MLCYAVIFLSMDLFSQPTAPLPFGPKLSNIDLLCNQPSNFYFKIIGRNTGRDNFKESRSYMLAEIKDLVYVKVDSINDSDSCSDNIGIDTLFTLKKYKKKITKFRKV